MFERAESRAAAAAAAAGAGLVLAACASPPPGGGVDHAPIARISGPETLNVDILTDVLLDGSQSSDPDGTPLQYQWRIASLPEDAPTRTATLATPTAATTTFRARTAGTYTVNLFVSDGRLESMAAEQRLEVSDEAFRPIVSVDAPTEVPLNSKVRVAIHSASDPNDLELRSSLMVTSLAWDLPREARGDEPITWTASAPHATYIISGSTTNALGLTTTDSVTCATSNSLPEVEILSQVAASPRPGQIVNLRSRLFDGDADPLASEWTLVPPDDGVLDADGTNAALHTPHGHPSDYEVFLTVSDGIDTVATSQRIQTVNGAPTVTNCRVIGSEQMSNGDVYHRCVVDAGGIVSCTATVTVTCNYYDPDDDPLEVQWAATTNDTDVTPTIVTDGAFATISLTAKNASDLVRTYLLHASVRDPYGASTVGNLTLDVRNRAPVFRSLDIHDSSKLSIENCAGACPRMGNPTSARLVVDLTGDDPDEDPLSVEWELKGAPQQDACVECATLEADPPAGDFTCIGTCRSIVRLGVGGDVETVIEGNYELAPRVSDGLESGAREPLLVKVRCAANSCFAD